MNKIGKDFESKRKFVQNYELRKYRKNIDFKFTNKLENPQMLHAYAFEKVCDAQKPILFEDDVICFARYDADKIPHYITNRQIRNFYGEDGKCHDFLNNVCPDYRILFKYGLKGILDIINGKLKNGNYKDKFFLMAAKKSIKALLRLSKRYYDAAKKNNLIDLADTLSNVPANPPRSFREALQSLRFVSASFYFAGNFQIGFGRMDQYLYPYYKKDVDCKIISKNEALSLIKEFFLSLNRDIDLYPGVTIGDNGQSVVLGGITRDGKSAINELSYLIIEASRDLCLIDPKINLRIDKNTPDDLLNLGCELTQKGLGFPQYLNDEVIISGLVKTGYSLEDARDYAVAACWEYLIPGKGIDVVNQGAVSLPYAVDYAQRLLREEDFAKKKFDALIQKNINDQTNNVLVFHNVSYLPAPIISVFFEKSLEIGADITSVASYKNVGIHGAGIASAADAYAVIDNLIEKKDWREFSRLRSIVANNFVGYDDEYQKLVHFKNKTGNDDSVTNQIVRKLFDMFYTSCKNQSSQKRKIRPGSGTAQYYVWLTKMDEKYNFMVEPRIKATWEGRKDGAPLPSSLAPANEIKVNGILSVFKSFSNIDYQKIVNGGPITVEFTPSAIAGKEGILKLSYLIKYFVEVGNQELQLNLLNVDELKDAMEHPENHRNLIVRVWGWSGYFCELPREFQEQIVARHSYSL